MIDAILRIYYIISIKNEVNYNYLFNIATKLIIFIINLQQVTNFEINFSKTLW
jgi:hypothetical protein